MPFRSYLAIASALLAMASLARAQAVSPSVEDRFRKLEQRQEQMERELREKDDRIRQLERQLGAHAASTSKKTPTRAAAPPPAEVPAQAQTVPPPETVPHEEAAGGEAIDSGPGRSDTAAKEPSQDKGILDTVLGTYEQGSGFGLARTKYGAVNFGIYTYLRYLNQFGLDHTFTNGLGNETTLDKRNDLELNKVKLEFRGWLIDEHFRYVLYTWTNNAAQGLGAQVVVGGNLNWRFGPELTLGGGILSLPTTRSTQGNFPYWLTVDHRTIADEFFRGSYSQGVYGYGEQHGFGYFAMLANNLSTLGVDAGQTDNEFSTVSTALWWMPTTGEFGPRQGFGDYEEHQDLATRVGVHFTFSPEDRQSQPGTEDIDNTQIRLSNGTIVFTPGALAPGVSVEKVKYYMADLDAGFKYRGFALESEYYTRWLNDFRASGPLPEHSLFDHGFQVQMSQMILPKTLQAYTQGSYIFGDRNDAWETTFGFNYWIFHRRELRLNLEFLYDHRSPIGYTAVPQTVGGTGWIFNANLEMSF
jgi:hypothetical protein